MKQNLSIINEYLKNLFYKTNKLEELEKKVNELVVDEIMRDFTLHKPVKEVSGRYYVYQVKEDDYNHIVSHLKPIQKVLLPDMVVMAQKTSDECKILFRLTDEATNKGKVKKLFGRR